MYRVRTVFEGVPGTPWFANFHFDDQASGGAQGAVDAVAAFWAAIGVNIADDVTWTTEGDVAIISPGTGEIEGIFPVDPVTGVGGQTADALPWANQGLVRWRTGAYVGGREVRGRTFVPGLTEQVSTSGAPIPAIITSMRDAAQDLVADPDSELMVYSRKSFIASPVVSADAASYWAVLRSRRD